LKRHAGILLHPTSLPGGFCNGELGADAYRYIDFLHASGFTIWQTLPLGPTHENRSPYQSISAHAGNPLLISTQWLVDKGWLNAAEQAIGHQPEGHQARVNERRILLGIAYRNFLKKAPKKAHEDFNVFVNQQSFWLDDYAMFLALDVEFGDSHWNQWPEKYCKRDSKALANVRSRFPERIESIHFEQFLFFTQWLELKAYAKRKNVLLLGDMPIFVAYDSADVWAGQENFRLDALGNPSVVAGVPPDYFSDDGQRWGNPHYDWQTMKASGYAWWKHRLQTQLQLFDIVRIDHFRGFEAFWEIPADCDTAIGGAWVAGPGEDFFNELQQSFGTDLPLIAEDLGVITRDVDQLREQFDLPGMKVLQFAFDDGATNPYLPHNHTANAVIYTGTHDNDTTLGWYLSLDDKRRQYINYYLDCQPEQMPWPLIRCALASVAKYAIIPMQDILALDSLHRMNIPGTTEDNWQWRFQWSQLQGPLAERLHELVSLYGRVDGDS